MRTLIVFVLLGLTAGCATSTPRTTTAYRHPATQDVRTCSYFDPAWYRWPGVGLPRWIEDQDAYAQCKTAAERAGFVRVN